MSDSDGTNVLDTIVTIRRADVRCFRFPWGDAAVIVFRPDRDTRYLFQVSPEELGRFGEKCVEASAEFIDEYLKEGEWDEVFDNIEAQRGAH